MVEEKNEGNEIIVIEQLPIITERLAALGEEIDAEIEKALALECTEESKQEVKAYRAKLNKMKEGLEEKRISVKKAILDPYNQFESVYNSFIKNKFAYADDKLKNRIEVIENKQKNDKKQEAISFFGEYKTSLKIDFVKFEDVKLNITLSSTKKGLQKSITEFLDRVALDIETLNLQEHKEEMLVEYKSNGYKLNEAMQTVLNRIERIKAEKERQEELAKQKELEAQTVAKVDEVATPIEQPLEAPVSVGVDLGTGESKQVETNIFRMTFTVYGTKEQLKGIKNYLESEGIKYE